MFYSEPNHNISASRGFSSAHSPPVVLAPPTPHLSPAAATPVVVCKYVNDEPEDGSSRANVVFQRYLKSANV